MKNGPKFIYFLCENIDPTLFNDLKDFFNWCTYFGHSTIVMESVAEKYKEHFDEFNISFSSICDFEKIRDDIQTNSENGCIVLIEDKCHEIEDMGEIIFWTGEVTCCERGCDFYYVKNFSMIKETIQTISELE